MSIRRIVSHPATIIVLLPLLVASPQLIGLLDPDPMLRVAYLALHVSHGLANPGFNHGWPALDPNDGFTTQALGHLAAWDWLHGIVPWWNPYSGVGLPLAGEYQPSAFSPLILLQLLPRAMALQRVALQIIAGLGAYCLLDALRVGPKAAATGGVLFAFNGAIAWFSHAPAFPIPFLPWMLFGIERIHQGGSWRWFALALAMTLLAGFPETAYINGLLVLLWAGLRLAQSAAGMRPRYALGVLLGGLVGIAISAPQLLAFFSFLPHAQLGGHDLDGFSKWGLPPVDLVLSLVAPYVFGPIQAYTKPYPELVGVWNAGGYLGLPVLAMALLGLILRRRSAVAWLLAAWLALALAKTFGLQPIVSTLNVLPGMAGVAFFRYGASSWILAAVILTAFGLDTLAKTERAPRRAFIAVGIAAGMALAGSVAWIAILEARLQTGAAMRGWAAAAFLWAALMTGAVMILAFRGAGSFSTLALPRRLLMADAALMALLPTISLVSSGQIDMPAVRFLQANLGSYRFYSLGPFQPNYGAYFRIASINHNYLPVAKRWTDWVAANLDPAADPIIFNGAYRAVPDVPPLEQELRDRLAAYEWTGVKYVVSPTGGPLINVPGARVAYSDRLLTISELPAPRPYFEMVSGECTLSGTGARTRLTASCTTPGVLLRRELFFPGWSARVNGAPAAIRPYRDLFQAVDLPQGQSTIAFTYAPPHSAWAWLAAALGVLVLAAPARWRGGAPDARKAA